MSNNYDAKDGTTGSAKTFKSTDNGGVHTPHKNIDVIASGASADIGAVADAAVVTDTTGSLSGKMRGLVKWAFERMPASLGQKVKTASFPVVLASDQDALALAAGSASIGGVKNNGPFYTVAQQYTTSADASGGVNITTDPDSSHRIVIDDLVISVGTTMEVSISEVSGAGVIFSVFLLANTAFAFSPTDGLRGSLDKQIKVIASVSGQIRVFASWHEET